MKKRLVAQSKVTTEELQVNVSELKNVKGFWETTITKLRDNWITTLKELKERMDATNLKDFQDVLTPIQWKQAQNYFIENPYSYV